MDSDTRELRRDIDETRNHLGTTLDTIGDRVSPGRIVARRKDRLKARVGSVRDSVMGTAESAGTSLHDGAHRVADTVGSAAGAIGDEARHAPEHLAATTGGNPLAAGMVAFGIGMIVASLIPATEPEQHAAAAVKDKLEPLQDHVREVAGELQSAVQDSARNAADEVRSKATEAMQEVKDDAGEAASDLKERAGKAAADVAQSASGDHGASR